MTHRALWVRFLLFLTVLSCLHTKMSGQVTFSRGWKAGKRIPPDIQSGAAIRPADEISKLLFDEFRQLAACETKSLLRLQKDYDDNQAEIFLEGQDRR